MNPDREHDLKRDLERRYRAASEVLDERPAASTRAAILAAAAREVGARPLDAAAPHFRPRWPLAAAAAVLLSTLAVVLATRTGDEMPQFSAAPESRPSAATQAADSQMAESAAGRAASPALAVENAEPAKPKPIEQAARRAESSRNEQNEQRDAKADPQRRQRPPATDSMQGLAPPTPAAPAPPAPVPEMRAAQPSDQTVMQRQRESARAPSPAASKPAELDSEPSSAAAWLDRIIQLRREARHADADAELKRFRERYPQVSVPAAALESGEGTR